MIEPSSSSEGGDFTGTPPPPEPAGQPLAASPSSMDIRKQPTLSHRLRGWLLAASIPAALAVVSWFLGGGWIWGAVAVLGAVVLVLLLLGVLAVKTQDQLRLSHLKRFGYLVVCWLCWTAVGVFLPLTTVEVKGDLIYKMEKEPTCPLRVSYGGQIRVFLGRSQECSFQFRGRFQRDQLKIESLAPEGWGPRSFRDYDAEVRLEEIPTVGLHIDNRANGDVTLVCGRVGFPIAGNSQKSLRIPALPGAPRSPLTLDGEKIGTFEGKDLLVDTLGMRSYRLRKITYGGIIDQLALNPLDELRLSRETVFQPGHVHQLPGKIDYFLEAAPKEIKVTTIGGLPVGREERTELREMQP